MAAITAGFGSAASVGASLGDATTKAQSVQRATAFDDAIGRVNADPASSGTTSPAQQVAEAARPAGRSDVPYENSGSSRVRARQALELNGVTSATDGDAILGGLQKLRGVFDAQHKRINDVMSSQSVDTKTLLSMQMEIAQYSVLVDVSSKLTGKSTALFDTLMKGQ